MNDSHENNDNVQGADQQQHRPPVDISAAPDGRELPPGTRLQSRHGGAVMPFSRQELG